MLKRIVVLSFVVLISGASAHEHLLSEKEAIKAVIEKETTGWANRNFETWSSAWQHSDDVMAVFVSPGSYSETIGWDELSANMKWQFENYPAAITDRVARENFVIRVDGAVAWVTFEQFRWREGSGERTHSREQRSLVKDNGRWKIASLTTIYDDRFEPSPETVESTINTAGYQLLSLDKLEEAIAVFELNVALFPDSWNVYDSLGEAYMKAGETGLAIENYSWSVQLNPNNKNGAAILKKLTRENESFGRPQGGPLCEKRVGEYATNDRAYQVRNELQQKGYEAWIKYHGSFLSGTRTYVVFAMLPCE